jgi:hypothetical protein
MKLSTHPRRLGLITLTGLALSGLAAVAPAYADSDIGSPNYNAECGVGLGAVFADTDAVVPTGGGTITSFSHADTVFDAGKSLDFEVLRPDGGNVYTVVGHTGSQPMGQNGLQTYPAGIRVTGGEILAIYMPAQFLQACLLRRGSGLVYGSPVGGDPETGQSIALPDTVLAGFFSLDIGAHLQTASAPSATGTDVAVTEGASYAGQVATFTDSDNEPVSAYTASIDWGDGSASAGTVTRSDDGSYSVSGSHSYAEEGSSAVKVHLTDSDGTGADATSTATVADAALSATGTTFTTTNPASGTVATFTDADPNGVVADYTASIDWGDGTNTPGTVSGTGPFQVSGSHQYADLGPHTVSTHVCDVGGACADATSQVLVYATAGSGSFVVGAAHTLGAPVTFWSSQWAIDNSLANGVKSFKGYENGKAAPTCGNTWTAGTGNSASPSATVPSYLAVVVSTRIQQSGSTVSGRVSRVEIVKTNPGYGPDPGHTGTGTAVAVVCGD